MSEIARELHYVAQATLRHRSEDDANVLVCLQLGMHIQWTSCTQAQFLALPQAEDVSDFHCVTTWSPYDNQWGGVRFRTVAELAES
jgi:hypothetical protein